MHAMNQKTCLDKIKKLHDIFFVGGLNSENEKKIKKKGAFSLVVVVSSVFSFLPTFQVFTNFLNTSKNNRIVGYTPTN
jgi:hypothetical protein